MKSLLIAIFKPSFKRVGLVLFISLFVVTFLVFLMIGLAPNPSSLSSSGNAITMLGSVLSFITLGTSLFQHIAYKYFSTTINGLITYSAIGNWLYKMAVAVNILWCYVVACLMEFILFGIPRRKNLDQALAPFENLPLGSIRLGLGLCLALVVGRIAWTNRAEQRQFAKRQEQTAPPQLRALQSSVDVTTWLNQTYPGDVLKRGAVTQLQKAYENAIDHADAPQENHAILQRLGDAIVCFDYRFPNERSSLQQRIESEVLYNEARRQAYRKVEFRGAGGYTLKDPALACEVGAKEPEVSHPRAILSSSARRVIRVITPATGAIWQVGPTTQVPLSWEMPCTIEVVQLDLYRNDQWVGSMFPPSMRNANWKNCSGNGRERFTTSGFLNSSNSVAPGPNYKVRMTSKDGTVYGESGFFTIEKHP